MTILKRLVFLVMVLGLAACDQANIINPANNSTSPTKPDLFEIVFSNGIPTDLAIQLNVVDVTDKFDVTEAGAVADGSTLAGNVYPGRNVLRVSAYNKVVQSYFEYDTNGPKIHIMDVDRGTMTVTGYVADSGGVQSVSLDGSPVALESDNSFSVAFMDKPFNLFHAIDAYGHESETTYARKDQEFNGIAARLNQGGLNFLVSALEQELAKTDFQDIVGGLKPVTLLDAGLFDLTMRVTRLNLDNIDIGLNVLDNEKIDTDLATDNFQLGVAIGGSVWTLLGKIPWETGAVIQMDNLNVATELLLDILNSDLDIALSGTQVNHSSINIDFDSTPGILNFIDRITSSIVSSIAPLFERIFIDLLEQIIIPIVSEFVKDIPIQLQLITLDDGEEMKIKALPTYLDSFGKGISVDLGTRIWAPNPPANIPGALGSLYRGGDTPSLGATTPSGTPFDFGASISDNVVNQALFAAHEAGVTTMDINPGTYSNATPEGIAVYDAKDSAIKDADKIGMRIEPVSPPYVKFMPDEDGAAGMLGWDDVTLVFTLYKAEWGEYRTLFGVTFNLEVAFDVNSTDDGFLSIGIEQLPNIKITATDNTGMILIPPGFINSTLDYFMPAVMPRLAQELKVIPLPRIYNHTLHMQEFWVAGSANNNLSLAGDLIPISTTEAAAEPETTIEDVATVNLATTVEKIDASGVISNENVEILNGEVTIDVNGLNPNPTRGLLEYRYRVDGGGWTNWKPRREIHLTRLLAGDHQVEVCSRTALLKREVSCPVVEFTTIVQ